MTREISLSLPESLQFWMALQNRNALERIVAQKIPPPSLAWDELKEFYRAKFSYDAIRFDYYLFLREAWERTWGDALQGMRQGEFIDFSAGEYLRLKDADYILPLAPEDVFLDKLVRCYTRQKENEVWWFGISMVTVNEALYLYWYRESNGEDVSKSTDLPSENWENEPDEQEYRVTKKSLCKLAADTEIISMEGLRRAAANALESA